MQPLIGVTTSEMRRGDLATLRRHGEPPHPEMALGPDRTCGRSSRPAALPVVLPPLDDRACRGAARPPRRRLPVRRPRPRPGRLRRPRPPRASSGRRSRRSTRFELALARAADAAGMPLLGVCRGAQTLNVARGGTLHQHVDGHRQTELGDRAAHAVRIAPRSRLAALGRRPAARSTPSTTRRSTRSATGLRVAARAADGTIEAIEDPRRPFLRRRPVARRDAGRRTAQLALFERAASPARRGRAALRVRLRDPVGSGGTCLGERADWRLAISLRGVVKRYGAITAVDRPRPRGARGHLRRPARPQRRRQVHHHAPADGAGDRRRGRDRGARPRAARRLQGRAREMRRRAAARQPRHDAHRRAEPARVRAPLPDPARASATPRSSARSRSPTSPTAATRAPTSSRAACAGGC